MSSLVLDVKDRNVTGGTHSWPVALPFDLKTKQPGAATVTSIDTEERREVPPGRVSAAGSRRRR